ncbi:MAG: hypothetical protein KC486_35510, partial [Myxococcales bacterium]|nr:hypothetical protein [Myxococcales bacterium]
MLGTDKGATWGRRLRVLLGLALLSCRGPDAPGPPLDGATLLPGFDPAALVEGLPPRVGEAPPLA